MALSVMVLSKNALFSSVLIRITVSSVTRTFLAFYNLFKKKVYNYIFFCILAVSFYDV